MNSQFTKIIRILLGLALIVFGANKLLTEPLIPLPTLPDKAAEFMTSLSSTGYILKTIGIIEIVIGVLLLLKKWVPFALIALVPITLNILLFHLFLDLSGIGIALLIAVLNAILIYKNWIQFKPLFT